MINQSPTLLWLSAVLSVDHSVVDLETIEALYENVRIILLYGLYILQYVWTTWWNFWVFFIKLSESSAPRAGEDQAALWDVKGRRREAPGQTRTVSISTAETNVWPVRRPVVLVCAVMLMSLFSRFLYELFRIPDFEGRAHCMIFQSVFNDTIASVHRKLDTVSSVCKVRRKNKQTPEI